MLITELADRLAIHKNTLRNWIAAFREHLTTPVIPGDTLDINDRDVRLLVWIAALRNQERSMDDIRAAIRERQTLKLPWPGVPDDFLKPRRETDIGDLQEALRVEHDLALLTARRDDVLALLDDERRQRLVDAQAYAHNLSTLLDRAAHLMDNQGSEHRQLVSRLAAQIGMIYAYYNQRSEELRQAQDKLAHVEQSLVAAEDGRATADRLHAREKAQVQSLLGELTELQEQAYALNRQARTARALRRVIIEERVSHRREMERLADLLRRTKAILDRHGIKPPSE